ncbi:hypothetical protein niasHT_020314 [Heterodera trifolii]|uniref:Uncharacterized protein n=1 Tax=Heterodera trifolii TaxID=157864 RepID=A0ABD2JQP2_9BILA
MKMNTKRTRTRKRMMKMRRKRRGRGRGGEGEGKEWRDDEKVKMNTKRTRKRMMKMRRRRRGEEEGKGRGEEGKRRGRGGEGWTDINKSTVLPSPSKESFSSTSPAPPHSFIRHFPTLTNCANFTPDKMREKETTILRRGRLINFRQQKYKWDGEWKVHFRRMYQLKWDKRRRSARICCSFFCVEL